MFLRPNGLLLWFHSARLSIGNFFYVFVERKRRRKKGKKYKEKESDEEFLNYGRLVSSYTKAYCSAGFDTFVNPLMNEFPGI